jgi:signal transduction histidine kinase
VEILAEVLEQVKRLDKTVNDLLYFGKPSPPEPVFCDLNAIVNKTLSFASQYKGGAHVSKNMDLDAGIPMVFVDPKQIHQVLLNIILNAFQAMPAGGTLGVSTQCVEIAGKQYVRAAISDTGYGIPPQVLGKLFTPFFTTKAQGTGLGLAICQKIIHQHNGEIHAASENAKGTVFTIDLPVIQEGPNLCPDRAGSETLTV